MLQFLSPVTVPQETVLANTLESVRQYMQQEAPDEFIGGQGHRFDLIAVPVILPLKADVTVFDIEQTIVGDCDPVSIAAHVVENLLRSGEGTLGIRPEARTQR